MPELPEVENVVRTLSSWLKDRTIISYHLYYDNLFHNKDEIKLIDSIINKKVTSVKRVGKFIVIEFNDIYLVSHLRMEGKYFLKQSEDRHKYLEISFLLDSGEYLLYTDMRKFGKMYIRSKDNLKSTYPLNSLGVDALNASVDTLNIHDKREIKAVLLDQSVIAGIGNIYADEILFMSKINPKTIINLLTNNQRAEIITNAKDILLKAIDLGGSTISSFEYGNGHLGEYSKALMVYGRSSKTCYLCNSIIKKEVVAGRGTSYCPTCQHKPLIGAVTGDIASGKTTVVKTLSYKSFDTDIFVNSLYQDKDKDLELFLKTTDVKFDKKSVLERVLSDRKFNKDLKRIIYKKVESAIVTFIKDNFKEQIILLDVPQLFEAKLDYLSDFIVYVTADKNIRELRASKRNTLGKNAIGILEKDILSSENKIKQSDYVIENNSVLDLLDDHIKRLNIILLDLINN